MSNLFDQWKESVITVYDSQEMSTLELLEDITSFNDEIAKGIDDLDLKIDTEVNNLNLQKTDLNGDHKGSWQGINRPTLSDEGMRATVEKLNTDIPKIENEVTQINSQLEQNTNKTYKNKFNYIDGVSLVSHRGVSILAPENSLKSIALAKQYGYDLVEIDLKKTSDGEIVLMHDSTLDRTTNGSGDVSSKTLAEIKKLQLKKEYAGAIFDDSIYRVPTLEEALILISELGLGITIDYSGITWDNSTIKYVVDLLKKYRLYEKTMFQIAWSDYHDTFYNLYSDICVGSGGADFIEYAKNKINAVAFIDGRSEERESLCELARNYNIPIYLYNVDYYEYIDKNLKYSPRFIETTYMMGGSKDV